MPGWQVAWMWLGGSVSHLTAEALWALMYINEIGYCHTSTVRLCSVPKENIVLVHSLTEVRLCGVPQEKIVRDYSLTEVCPKRRLSEITH